LRSNIKDIYCLIPAKDNSIGINKKNLIKFLGKSLVEWTFNSANKSIIQNKNIYVSSNSELIIQKAKKYNINSAYVRPKYLCKKNIHTINVVLHFIKYLKKNNLKIPYAILMLLPTSPLRTFKDINKSINLFQKKNVDAVIGVTSLNKKINNIRYIKKNNELTYLNKKNLNLQRDRFKTLYAVNGAIFLAKTKMIEKYKTFHLEKASAFIMDEFSSIDVNYKEDLIIAKKYYKLINEKKN